MSRFERHGPWARFETSTRRAYRAAEPPFGFAMARTALKWGLTAEALRSGDRVLLPELICESVLHPLQELALEPSFYRLDDRLQPVWEEVERRAAGARAILMVHLFGQPQEVERFEELCQRRDLLLIGDNTHGYGGEIGGRPMGELGDFSISAPRKLFGLRHGAYLFTRRPLPPEAFVLPLQPHDAELGSLDDRLWNRVASKLHLSFLELSAAATQRIRERRLPDWAMDEAVHELIQSQDVEGHRRVRQAAYRAWESWAHRCDELEPVFEDLASGAMPLCFPAWSRSERSRARWLAWGRRHGFEIYTWPTLPSELVRSDCHAYQQWRRLVCFPIHGMMDTDSLQEALRRTPVPSPSR